jgi:hypothetical protein
MLDELERLGATYNLGTPADDAQLAALSCNGLARRRAHGAIADLRSGRGGHCGSSAGLGQSMPNECSRKHT